VGLPDLEQRCAVVTGASRGLGAGLAEAFAAAGLRLGLCSRSAPALAGSDRVLARRVDVRDEKAIDAFVDEVGGRFGAIDLWVNNAGVLAPIGPVRGLEVEAFRDHIDINLTGVFLGTRAYLRHLEALGRGGVLINVSSGAAWKAYHGWGAYCAGKAGVAADRVRSGRGGRAGAARLLGGARRDRHRDAGADPRDATGALSRGRTLPRPQARGRLQLPRIHRSPPARDRLRSRAASRRGRAPPPRRVAGWALRGFLDTVRRGFHAARLGVLHPRSCGRKNTQPRLAP